MLIETSSNNLYHAEDILTSIFRKGTKADMQHKY